MTLPGTRDKHPVPETGPDVSKDTESSESSKDATMGDVTRVQGQLPLWNLCVTDSTESRSRALGVRALRQERSETAGCAFIQDDGSWACGHPQVGGQPVQRLW